MWSVLLTGLHWHDAWDWGRVCVCVRVYAAARVLEQLLRGWIDGNRLRSRGVLKILIVLFCLFSSFFFLRLSRASPAMDRGASFGARRARFQLRRQRCG